MRYYPTPEQARTIVEENIIVNFQWDTMYSIPFIFPCDKNSHFELEMMKVLVLDNSQNAYMELTLVMNDWYEPNVMAEFEEFFKQHKGRPFNE